MVDLFPERKPVVRSSIRQEGRASDPVKHEESNLLSTLFHQPCSLAEEELHAQKGTTVRR